MAFRKTLDRPGAPQWTMTLILLVIFVGCLLVGWVPDLGARMMEWLAFDPRRPLPWTFLTYPLASEGLGGGFLFIVFLLLWWYWVGHGLEATTGRWGLLANFGVFTLLGSLVVWVAVLLGLQNPPMDILWGPYLGVEALSVAFFASAPESSICYWGITVRFKWLALFVAVLFILTMGLGNPLFGVVAALPLLLAWFYGQGKLPVRLGEVPFARQKQKKRQGEEFQQFMSKVKSKEKEREERERLRKLFEDSLED